MMVLKRAGCWPRFGIQIAGGAAPRVVLHRHARRKRHRLFPEPADVESWMAGSSKQIALLLQHRPVVVDDFAEAGVGAEQVIALAVAGVERAPGTRRRDRSARRASVSVGTSFGAGRRAAAAAARLAGCDGGRCAGVAARRLRRPAWKRLRRLREDRERDQGQNEQNMTSELKMPVHESHCDVLRALISTTPSQTIERLARLESPSTDKAAVDRCGPTGGTTRGRSGAT